VQELLRHSNIKTTLDIYAQAITPAKLEAQGTFLNQLLTRFIHEEWSGV
jgi:integrase